MSTALFSFDHLTVRHLSSILFSNLSFKVNQGEHWALIGESGSGKSALLQTIAGRFNITGGEIKWDFFNDYLFNHSQHAGSALTHHKFIALVEPRHHWKNLSNTSDFYYQQRYNSSDSEDVLTVNEYLNGIANNPSAGNYWTLVKVTDLLNLDHLLDKQLIKLSNGETKRLMIAAALLKNPIILLLDSPLTGLDLETRTQFNMIISKIITSGITLVMATSPYEIPDAITNIAVLQQGTIVRTINKNEFDARSFFKIDKTVDNTDKLKALLTGGSEKTIYQTIVEMKDVVIRYGEKMILNKINWQINPGERWALLGPNGAGKSTLLSLINGDNPQAYANDIILFDRKRGSGESIWDIKSKIGFMSPELHQYFPTDNSCLQVIESGYYDTLGLFRQSEKTKANIAMVWMNCLEIDKYALVPFKNIPASAQRLCLLARALIKNPTLLIFDEPCQGLDGRQQQHFKTLLDTICNLSNVALIYVTHYRHEIPDSVTKVLKLDKGNVVV